MKQTIAKILLAVIGSACTTTVAQIGQITNPGRVVNEQGQPLKDAMITYTSPAKRLNYAFSNANGDFGGTTAAKGISAAVSPSFLQDVSMSKGSIRFYLNGSHQVTVTLYDMKGRALFTPLSRTLEQGAYSVDPGGAARSRIALNAFIVRIQADRECATVKLVNVKNGGASRAMPSHETYAAPIAVIAKTTVATDTVRVGKTGYVPVYKPINSATESVGTVTLVKIDIEKRIDTVMARLSIDDKYVMMVMHDRMDPSKPYAGGVGIINAGGVITANDFHKWNEARMSQGIKVPGLAGNDMVHGMIGGSGVEPTIFPHNVGMGCIQDTQLIQKAGRVTAIEGASRGMYWAFAPCVSTARNEYAGRIYEYPGETPEICARVTRHLVLGMQGRDLSLNTSIVATAKHFAGDGGTESGGFPGSTVKVSDAAMRAIHLPPYAAAVQAEIGCIMSAYTGWRADGGWVGMTANKPLLTDWLKVQQKFDGFIVSDWEAHTYHGAPSTDPQACTHACINAGLDVCMAPPIASTNATIGYLKNGYTGGKIPLARIDDACRRVLRVLFRKGLFDNYRVPPGYDQYFHCDEHKKVARECVAASMVVLKNGNNTLPLKKGTQKISVIGSWGNSVGLQCGAWTLGWHGSDAEQKPKGTTMYMSLQQQGGGNTVSYSRDGDNIPNNVDAIVVCMGTPPGAEYTKFDSMNTLGYFPDTKCGANTMHCYNTIGDLMGKATAVKSGNGKAKIVLALYVDGPAAITKFIEQADAVVCTWLGSPEGAGYGDILYGDVHPSGKLNHTWPKTLSQIPINDGTMGDAVGSGGEPLFKIGWGLTY